jgi:hypothetical protein
MVTLFTLYVITMMCDYSYIKPLGQNFMSFCSRSNVSFNLPIGTGWVFMLFNFTFILILMGMSTGWKLHSEEFFNERRANAYFQFLQREIRDMYPEEFSDSDEYGSADDSDSDSSDSNDDSISFS